eukprot:TRINITY_DN3139_c0_g2_i1.p1 TRINITY_DN3139_c0_g2~~TRINITY_DN3139_c0_g2_i1.p1  ORF type:complete len:138 (-),score=16.20 TRINITY_DN3139_c0_g2_i1:73-486(-)
MSWKFCTRLQMDLATPHAWTEPPHQATKPSLCYYEIRWWTWRTQPPAYCSVPHQRTSKLLCMYNYFDGAPGTGKSTSLFVLAWMLRHHGCLVLYISQANKSSATLPSVAQTRSAATLDCQRRFVTLITTRVFAQQWK